MSPTLPGALRYHTWSSEWIKPYLSGRILDVGGGLGNHLLYLNDFEVVSLDISEECIDLLKNRYKNNLNSNFILGDITKEDSIQQLKEKSFDTVLSCNVFEHIKDDGKAFKNAYRLLRPGGRLVLLLPSHKILYGRVDRLAGHYRRYDKKMVGARLTEAGFSVERLRYVNILGAIGWFLNIWIIRPKQLSSKSISIQIKIFDRLIVPIMRLIEGDRSMPFGQSLVCVGRKV